MNNILCSSAALALVLLTVTNALASEPPDTPERAEATEAPAKPHDDILLTAGAGVFGNDDVPGWAVNATGIRQNGWLGYGATFEYGEAFVDTKSVTAAPVVGVFVPGPRWLRLGLAATGGLHSYRHVGGELLTSDPGANGVAPFVGARAFVGAEVGGKVRLHVGLQLSADDDLTRVHDTYTYEESMWSTPHPVTVTHTVGTWRFGAMLAVGTAFDL